MSRKGSGGSSGFSRRLAPILHGQRKTDREPTDDARLRAESVVVPGVIGAAPLRLHARFRDYHRAEAVARLAGAAPPIVIPGWGHAVYYDDADAVAGVVLGLVRTIAGPEGREIFR